MSDNIAPEQLKLRLQKTAKDLGFQQCGVATTNIAKDVDHYRQWLKKQYYGDMEYMASREALRADPAELVPNTLSVISVRLNYVPTPSGFSDTLKSPQQANISRYALGRDYHKLMRKKLSKLAKELEGWSDELNYRVFVDSAPVLERAYAQQAGLGWIGKNTMLINEAEGSFFFLGEILTNLPLPADSEPENQCGACTSCINICPTQAIVAPYTLDARKCISYLTIEHFGSIPVELRSAMGNRVYGCDDCQLVCPWNRYANATEISDFKARHNLDTASLLELFEWSKTEFLSRMEGSPIRRIGYERWQRNLAVGLGNANHSPAIIEKLQQNLRSTDSPLVKEHIEWAIAEQQAKAASRTQDSQSAKRHQKLIRTTEKLLGHLDGKNDYSNRITKNNNEFD